MTRQDIFKTAHRLAKEIIAEENIKVYSKALKRGLKLAWNRFNQIKQVQNLPTWLKEQIKPKLFTENMDVIELLQPLSYKSWKVGVHGMQMFFSDEIINEARF